MDKQIFVNLAVKDLKKSMDFFTKLGFKFNPQFTDNKAACMIISKNIYSMLIVEKYFKTFTKKNLINAKKDVEVLLALTFESRKKVDEILAKGIKAGGKETRKDDIGWMYSRSLEDLDGHIWEIFWMDVKKMKK